MFTTMTIRAGFPRSGRPAGQKLLILGLLVGLPWGPLGCGRDPWDPTLPPSGELGAPRGQAIARMILHLHSPYSHDACDGAGLSGSTPNASCLADLKRALCQNHIDFAFLTDHPSHMAEYGFGQL